MKKMSLGVMSFLLATMFFTTPSVMADGGRFGVIASGKVQIPGSIAYLKDLGISWLRVNAQFDGNDQDFTRFLDAGFNLIITVAYRDQGNVDTTYGSLDEYSHGGFPFKSKELYQKRIREALTPLLPYLKKGRQIMVQCENEIGPADINPKAHYWRGSMEQYLRQLDAMSEAVHGLNPSMKVVLSSFTSEGLDKVISTDPNDQRSKYATRNLTTMLTEGNYDAADLHFYGCVEDIPKKINWVKSHMPKGKLWISTEDGGPDYRCNSTPLHYKDNPGQYEELEAKQVSQRLGACAEGGGSVCLWFSFTDLIKEVEVFNRMGLLDQRGLANYKDSFKKMKRGGGQLTPQDEAKITGAMRKKPAYYAFQDFVKTHR